MSPKPTLRLSLSLALSSLVLAGCPADGGVVDVCANPNLVCDDANACTADSCDPRIGCVNEPIGCDDGDACTSDRCDPRIGCVSTPVSCNDGNLCTADTCDPVFGCTHTDISANCDDGNACTANSCNPSVGCVTTFVDCNDGNPCTADSCNSATGCRNVPRADGTPCNSGSGLCQAGVCMPASLLEFMEDFESFDPNAPSILGDTGWLAFGDVFDGSTMHLLDAYGPDPAPNGAAAFSVIVSGEGEAAQGERQLSVFSDHENTDHAAGNLVAGTAYWERTITVADVGRTIRVAFDAKRGSINDPGDSLCPCGGVADVFIETLDPATGFATTSLVAEDTSALPDAWARYELSLPIETSFVGHLLRVGFTAIASDCQPSSNFYDNVEVRSTPTLP